MRPLTHALALSMGLMALPDYDLHAAGVAVVSWRIWRRCSIRW